MGSSQLKLFCDDQGHMEPWSFVKERLGILRDVFMVENVVNTFALTNQVTDNQADGAVGPD